MVAAGLSAYRWTSFWLGCWSTYHRPTCRPYGLTACTPTANVPSWARLGSTSGRPRGRPKGGSVGTTSVSGTASSRAAPARARYAGHLLYDWGFSHRAAPRPSLPTRLAPPPENPHQQSVFAAYRLAARSDFARTQQIGRFRRTGAASGSSFRSWSPGNARMNFALAPPSAGVEAPHRVCFHRVQSHLAGSGAGPISIGLSQWSAASPTNS